MAANILCSLQAPFFSWPKNQCYLFAAKKKKSGVSVSATHKVWGFCTTVVLSKLSAETQSSAC
jgi:hypothetical protein